MTKAEIIAQVQEKVDKLNRKEAGVAVDAVIDVIKKAIIEEKKLTYPGLGTFSVKTRKAREGRNPHTSEKIMIPETNTVSFRPAPKLKEVLNVKDDGKKAAAKKVAAKADAKDSKKDSKKACKKSK